MKAGTGVLIGHAGYDTGRHRWLGQMPYMLMLTAMARFTDQLPRLRPMSEYLSMTNKSRSMALLRELLETGKLTPHVDRTFPLSEVPEAIRYLQEGHAKGKVVITVSGPAHLDLAPRRRRFPERELPACAAPAP